MKRLRSRSLRSYRSFVEPLEGRFALDGTPWASFAGNPQHTSISDTASQSLETIHWQAPVDNFPTSRAAHYGGPLITAANTVIYPYKMGTETAPDFHIIARNATTGALLWDESTDIIPVTDGWFPAVQPVYVPASNRVYFPAANGNLYYKDNVDIASGTSTKVLVSVFGATGNLITTALTADASGNIYYGYRNGSVGGFVKVTPAGASTVVTAGSISGEPAITDWTPQTNHAPAVSNDGQTLYIVIRRRSTSYYGRLIGLSTATMATVYNSGILKDPRGGGVNNAGLLNQSTASPMVAPDNHVYLGVFGNPYNGSRGWLLHFNADLTQQFTPGGFGWDTTPSVVPASMVPQYTGSSTYLLFTKYNNYYGITNGGDGSNAVAVLDPNDTEVEFHADSGGQLVMKRVLYKVGPTPDWDYPTVPTAVREWCINYGAVDPATNSVMVNCADGKFYRWYLPTNTLSEEVQLTSGIGQPYTMTVIGVDGTLYGIQIGQIFAIGQTPRMSISDAVLSEGTGGSTIATFTVSLNYPRTQTITVNYATADGSAVAGSDYTSTSGTLTFTGGTSGNPGQMSQTISVEINPDSLYEFNENFFINLSSANNAVILDGQGVGTINNDDAIPTLSINDVSQNEGNVATAAFIFTVTLSAPSGVTTTVNYDTANGTATGGDYFTASGMLTFDPGQTSKTISVLVAGDTTFEANETFFVNLSGAVNASASDNQGLGTILNDDNVPSIAIDDVSVVEGGTLMFTVSLSNSSSQTITVDFSTSDGTSTAGSDYTSAGGTVTFTPGSTAMDVFVSSLQDTLDELNETFFLNLFNPSNAFVSDSVGVGTINDNDPAPNMTIGDISSNEGASGTTSFTFTVSLSTVSGRSVTVNYATADGTATTGGGDYQSASGSLTFNAGETSKTVTVLVNGDMTNEPNETFFVNLSGANGATVTDSQAVGTIVNDDALILNIGDVSLSEGNSGTVAFVFTVNLSTSGSTAVTVNYATSDGTAADGSDYSGGSGTLTFNPGETSQTVTVLVNGDTLNEADETFFVNLSSPVGGAIGDGVGQGTILNDDPVVSIAIADVSVPEFDYNTGDVNIYVTLSQASGQQVTVFYETANGTASSTSANKDYIDTFGTLVFAPGQTVASFPVSIVGDIRDEPDETIRVLLSSPVNAALPDDLGIITIVDDDTVYVTINGLSVTEGNSGQTAANVVVDLSIPADYAITIDYATEDGTALAGTDYLAASGTLTFAAGITSQTIPLQVLGELLDELNESFEIILSNATPGVELGVYPEADVDIIDDDTALISISDVSVVEGNSGTRPAVFNVTLSNPSDRTISLQFATQNGTANGQDYIGNVATLSFSPGQTAKTITINVKGDTKNESNETFFVNLSNATNAGFADSQGVATILNDDGGQSTVEISINDVTVVEGGTAVFNVTLSAPSGNVITVNFTTADGTAIAGSDYSTTSGTLTFNPGETSKPISVATIDNGTSESTENFFVNLSSPTGASIADSQGVGTINDNDATLPAVSINDVSQLEGNSGFTPFIFTLTLSAPSAATVDVQFSTQNGTANGQDYVPNVAWISFSPGQTSRTVTINVYGDTKREANETFFVNLTNVVNAVISDNQGVGTIQNDDQFQNELLVGGAPLLSSGPLALTAPVSLASNRPNSAWFDRKAAGLTGSGAADSNLVLTAASTAGRFSIDPSSGRLQTSRFGSAVDGWTTEASEQVAYVLAGGELKEVAVNN